MCYLHLTHPSAHTWSSGQPTLRHPGSSWGYSALLKDLNSVVDNSCRSRDSNPQPWVTSPMLYPLQPWLPPGPGPGQGPGWCDGSHIAPERPPHTSVLMERRESDEANRCMGIIRRSWWSEANGRIWPGCRGYASALFRMTSWDF